MTTAKILIVTDDKKTVKNLKSSLVKLGFEVCDVTKRSAIQKTSIAQVFIVIGFMVYIFLAVLVFKDEFSKKPYALFEVSGSSKSK